MTWNLISKDKVLEEIDREISVEQDTVVRATRSESKLLHDYTLNTLKSLRKRIADLYDD